MWPGQGRVQVGGWARCGYKAQMYSPARPGRWEDFSKPRGDDKQGAAKHQNQTWTPWGEQGGEGHSAGWPPGQASRRVSLEILPCALILPDCSKVAASAICLLWSGCLFPKVINSEYLEVGP